MNRPAVVKFAACACEDLRRLWFHALGLLRSLFQP